MNRKKSQSICAKSLTQHGIKVPHNAVRIIKGRLGGKWLGQLGFMPDDVLMVDAIPGAITYRLQENGIARTLELVRFARLHKCQLIQVQRKGGLFIELPPSFLKRAGFAPDETLLALYEPGLLQLQRPDLS